MQTYDLLKFAIARPNGSNFSRSRDWNENGKCTNATNRRSHVGLSTPFYTDLIFDDAV